MLFRMARLFVFVCMIFCTFAESRADTGCSQQSQHQTATQIANLRRQLLAIKVEMGYTDVSASASDLIQKLKSQLNQAAQEVFACHDISVPPATIQQELATLLHANLPEPPDQPISDADIEKPEADVFGSGLKVRVSRASTSPLLLNVTFSFGVACGDDNILLLFEAEDAHWKEVLHWQAEPLHDVGHAFGDFFLSSILAGETPETWRVIVAHGKPWCTSRFSGFNIDVLEPTANAAQPRVVWHTDRGYSRGDFEPTLKASGNIFEFRINDDAMMFDSGTAFERRVIYRYRVNANTVDRIEPIAINARGFIEEWLGMPWNEAAAQTVDPASVALKKVHDSFQQELKIDSNTYTERSYGPVLACKPPREFQVEMKAERDTIVPGKPGGDSAPLPSTFYRVRETGNGYELLSASTKPDPQCGGPNLMHDQQ
jgi:hypothetical protein